MSLELDNDGPFARRRRDEAPAWPVLARLPLVDSPGQPAQRTPLPTFAADAPVGEPALEYVADAPQQHEPQHRAPQRQQSIDAPHPRLHVESALAAAAYHAPGAAREQLGAAREQLAPSTTTRRYRFDQGDPAHHVPRQSRPTVDQEPSLSDAIFRGHAALAPHMGAVSAAALLTAAAFVFWLAIGRQGEVARPLEGIQFGAGLTQSAPVMSDAPAAVAPVEAEANVSASAEAQLHGPAIEWATPPRVAEALAHPTNEVPAPATHSPASAIEPTGGPGQGAPSAGPALTPPADAATAPADSASASATNPQATHPAAEVDNGITPTPELDPYPTTSYAAFSFDQPPAAEVPAVAASTGAPSQH